ncbi:uncharacterized protein PAC_12280 [Phialocephala subalpina]|uniref:Uncharacterized protein n=1 Tax=Phialocephala subalpina TaxID=576137 RepID=A0A1L7XBI5_9HELO|nr:uncharacterized protein PAC_12280 [Phialocephala subalpina]
MVRTLQICHDEDCSSGITSREADFLLGPIIYKRADSDSIRSFLTKRNLYLSKSKLPYELWDYQRRNDNADEEEAKQRQDKIPVTTAQPPVLQQHLDVQVMNMDNLANSQLSAQVLSKGQGRDAELIYGQQPGTISRPTKTFSEARPRKSWQSWDIDNIVAGQCQLLFEFC